MSKVLQRMSISMSLPTPIGSQKEVLCLPAEGHKVVLGTAGSGKTTLAILRSAFLADPYTDHYGKTLLITFNRALVTYLKHLQEESLADVVIENYHKFARGYLASRNRMSWNGITDPDVRENLIEQAVEIVREENSSPILNRPKALFVEEFRWISQHGIKTAEEYRKTDRIGRANARIERKDRQLVFATYLTYQDLRESKGHQYDWDDLATAVCEELENDDTPRRYRHVVIDEGQDFSPEMLRSLARAIPPDGSLTFFGDVAQQIYGHRMSWRSAGLNVSKDEIWRFKENYRNSSSIARLGLAISEMPFFQGEPDLVEPVSDKAEGTPPTIAQFSSVDREIDEVVSQAKSACKRLSVAILLRDREDEKLISKKLPHGSTQLHRKMTSWRSGAGIWYGTYHSAKGLEFDMVILPFCNKTRLPDPEIVEAFGMEEAMSQDGRLLYVGVTRAKTRLLITFTGELTELLPQQDHLYRRWDYRDEGES